MEKQKWGQICRKHCRIVGRGRGAKIKNKRLKKIKRCRGKKGGYDLDERRTRSKE